ncbi:hypothetical protein Tco_0469643 [Tanacetum coccineum]
MINLYNLCNDFVKFADMGLPPRAQRHPCLRFEGLEYTNADIVDFEERLGKIYGRGVHRVQVFNFRGLTDLMVEGLSVHELILEFFSTFRFGEVALDLDTARSLQFQLDGATRRMSWREFILGMGLHMAEEMESAGFSAYWTKSAWRFASGRKRGAMISGGQFVACLAEHFGLFTEQRLQGLAICKELDDTWAWVAPRPERQPDAAASAPERVARLEEEVHSLQGSMAEQRDVLDSMACDFSRFTTWTVFSLSLMMDRVGVRYTSYSDFQIPYVKRTRCKTDDANTSSP